MMSALTQADVVGFQNLCITTEILDRAQVQRVDDGEARTLLGVNGRPGSVAGLIFPYWVPWLSHVATYRLKRDHPDIERGKPKNKYLSVTGDRRHVYVVETDPAALVDPSLPIIAVESEKAVLAITAEAERHRRRILPIGLGGCHSWKGRIGKVETADGGRADEYGVLPDFDHIDWKDRDVIVAFDANVSTNPTVQSARRAFGGELARRGAAVRFLTLPVEDGINGPDDFLGRHGAAAFFQLVDTAPDALTADVIYKLNHRHAVVREGGKTVVITEENDPVLNRGLVTRSPFGDFKNYYLNEFVPAGTDKKTGEPIVKPLGSVWLSHPDRRQYEGIVMSPGGDVPGYFNLWRGFAVEPKAGDWSLLQAHIRDGICAGDDTVFQYVMAWMAAGVQHPECPAEVAIAMRGPRGVGKGVWARTYGELFGQHYMQIANTRHLTGNFNAHLQDAIVLFADEAFWAGDKQGESVLKMLVTEPVIPIERKGRDVVQVKNLLHIIIASNHEWVVPAGVDERRFCVIDVDSAHQQDHAYFGAIVAQLDQGGRAAMLYDLLQYDYSTVDLREAPATEALRQQKVLSLQPAEKWLLDKLMAGRWVTAIEGWTAVPKADLHDDYVRHLQKMGIERRSTETELGMFIKRMFGSLVQPVRRQFGGRPYREQGLTLSDLKVCREAFDTVTKSQHPWPDEKEQEFATEWSDTSDRSDRLND